MFAEGLPGTYMRNVESGPDQGHRTRNNKTLTQFCQKKTASQYHLAPLDFGPFASFEKQQQLIASTWHKNVQWSYYAVQYSETKLSKVPKERGFTALWQEPPLLLNEEIVGRTRTAQYPGPQYPAEESGARNVEESNWFRVQSSSTSGHSAFSNPGHSPFLSPIQSTKIRKQEQVWLLLKFSLITYNHIYHIGPLPSSISLKLVVIVGLKQINVQSRGCTSLQMTPCVKLTLAMTLDLHGEQQQRHMSACNIHYP